MLASRRRADHRTQAVDEGLDRPEGHDQYRHDLNDRDYVDGDDSQPVFHQVLLYRSGLTRLRTLQGDLRDCALAIDGVEQFLCLSRRMPAQNQRLTAAPSVTHAARKPIGFSYPAW
jgi:hypothetical protein